MLLTLALALFLVALVLLGLAKHQQRRLGLPGGRVIYADRRLWGKVEKPLYDPELGLVGRPDYLISQGGALIPVEVKSSRVGAAPYEAHIFQLAAYCLLVHRLYGRRPPYGILHYPDRTFAIDYTPTLEAETLRLLKAMRRQQGQGEYPRSHQSPARCLRCGYRPICDQRLL